MAEERVQRRLAAILAADVVGYSRLMGEDETGTLNALNLHRAELIHPTVAEHRGRIVKLMGDGALVEFPSVVDAVECAVAVQLGMAERNIDVPESRRITFRIGINLGDIIIENDDIYGDGVNIAARLESQADPGGICLSSDAYRHVSGKIDLAFEDLGERTLKNIAEPVRAYRWLSKAHFNQAEPVTVPEPPAEKPSIAVLPFDNLSNDPEQEYFSDGLVEDLITDISKVSGLFVIARNSSFAFKGQSMDVKQIAGKLGVKHIVEGSVRKMGSRLRINAQLIDATTGGHIWAERYDGDIENIFDFQDDIRDQIVAALQVSLTPTEKSEAQRHLTDSVEAYELFLQARTEFFKFTTESMFESIRLYDQAIEVDPNFAAAYANRSTVLQTSWSFVLPGCEDNLKKALESAQKAVEIDPLLSLAHTRLGWVQCFMRQHEASIASFERALEIAPNDAEAHAYLSHVYNYLGEPERAIESVKTAFQFDPMLPPNVAFHWGEACFQARKYDEALEKLHECLDKAPGFFNARLILAAVLSEMGRNEEAVDELQIVREEFSDDFIRTHFQRTPYRSEEALARYMNGVREAGLPDETPATVADAPLPLPDKPSIAVLPFDNLSGDPEQEYFSDGITEDIITALSHIRQFFVIARNTTFTFKGQAVDVQAVAKDLGVRYVLEGSVRKAGNRARITAQLIDGETGNHVWAERYDRDLEDIFAVQDEITQIVVGALGPELSRAEQERAQLKPPDNLDAWNLYHRGLWHMWRYEKDDIAEARNLFQRAIESDPRHSPAFACLAYTYVQEMYLGLTDDPANALDQAMRFTGKALNLDDRDAFTYVIRAIANVFRRDHPAARNDARTALDINPSNAMAHMVLGISYHWCNEPGPSSHCFDEAERLSPRDPVIWLSLLGRTLGYLIEQKFEEANEVGKRAIAISNVPLVVRFVHAAALGHLDRLEEAQTAINTMLRINPGFSLKYVERVLPTNEQHVRDIILNGLTKAGAPVG